MIKQKIYTYRKQQLRRPLTENKRKHTKDKEISQEEINDIIFGAMYNRNFLEALMQEAPNGTVIPQVVIQKINRSPK